MMVRAFTESVVEEAALEWLEGLRYEILCGPEIAAGEPGAERCDSDYRDVILERRLRQALVQLNPNLPHEALDDAFRKLTRTDGPSLITRNRNLHRMIVDGVNVECARPDGRLDRAGKRPCPLARSGQTHPPQAWLSSRFAKKGDGHRAGTG